MKLTDIVLVLSVGSHESSAFFVDAKGQILGMGTQSFMCKKYMDKGVEIDPLELIYSLRSAVSQLYRKKHGRVVAIALYTVTQPSCVIWDKETGLPLTPVVRSEGMSFSHILKSFGKGYKHAFYGGIESWVVYHLTGRQVHLTDHTHASLTECLDLNTGYWNASAVTNLDIDLADLPQPCESGALFGQTKGFVPLADGIPILAILTETHAKSIGFGCTHFGDSYFTYGALGQLYLNVGAQLKVFLKGKATLFQTYGESGTASFRYGIDLAVPLPYEALKWVSPTLFDDPQSVQMQALSVLHSGGLKLKMKEKKVALIGLDAGVESSHMVRAFYEGVAYQVKDSITALEEVTGVFFKEICVDGPLSTHDYLMQMQADVLQIGVVRYHYPYMAVLGATLLAGIKCGVLQSKTDIAKCRKINKQFLPSMDPISSLALYNEWRAS